MCFSSTGNPGNDNNTTPREESQHKRYYGTVTTKVPHYITHTFRLVAQSLSHPLHRVPLLIFTLGKCVRGVILLARTEKRTLSGRGAQKISEINFR